jgi:cytoskeletal protein CcmA (bactofilin family)
MNIVKSKEGLLFNIICDKTEISGNIKADGDFRIDGKLIGNIECTGKVTIGYTGYVEGNISCQNAEISGEVKGSINGIDSAILKQNSKLVGSITTKNITVEAGAFVSMKCKTE